MTGTYTHSDNLCQAHGISEILARFAIETETLSLSGDVVHAARRAILDTLGVALAGSKEPASKIVSDYVLSRGAFAESTIWGTTKKSSASNAALANGTASHVLDFDDTHGLMHGHPSVTVLPAVLAMSERVHATGMEVLSAFAIGVEVGCRLGQLVGHDAYDRGWHATAIHGVLGATAAVGRLAGLSVDQMSMALGLAASHSSGIRQNFGTMTKSFHVGRVGESAITAVELVQRGFTASPTVIEGDAGYLAVFGQSSRLSQDALLSSIGSPFALTSPGVNVKVYPSCAFTHAAIDLALGLAGDILIDDINRIIVSVPYTAPLVLIHHRPKDPLSAKFSLEYCVATALVDKSLTLAHFKDDAVLRDDLQKALQRVEYVVPEEWQAPAGPQKTGQARMELHLNDGSERKDETYAPRGSSDCPLADLELAAKFLSCAEITLGSKQAQEIHEVILELDHLSSIEDLTDRLIPS